MNEKVSVFEIYKTRKTIYKLCYVGVLLFWCVKNIFFRSLEVHLRRQYYELMIYFAFLIIPIIVGAVDNRRYEGKVSGYFREHEFLNDIPLSKSSKIIYIILMIISIVFFIIYDPVYGFINVFGIVVLIYSTMKYEKIGIKLDKLEQENIQRV